MDDEKKQPGQGTGGYLNLVSSLYSTSSRKARETAAFLKLSRGRCRRLFSYLAARNAPMSTAEIGRDCGIGNISDAVLTINPLIREFGLQIINHQPKPALKNRFGETSFVHIWWLQDLPSTTENVMSFSKETSQ